MRPSFSMVASWSRSRSRRSGCHSGVRPLARQRRRSSLLRTVTDRLRVTVRLLTRRLGLEAGGEFGIVDEVVEELVPGLGREPRFAEHVRQLFDAMIGQRGDGLVRADVDAD